MNTCFASLGLRRNLPRANSPKPEAGCQVKIGHGWVSYQKLELPKDEFFICRLQDRTKLANLAKTNLSKEVTLEKIHWCLEIVRKALDEAGIENPKDQNRLMETMWDGTFILKKRDIDEGDSGKTYSAIRKSENHNISRKITKELVGNAMFHFRILRNIIREVDETLEDHVDIASDKEAIVKMVEANFSISINKSCKTRIDRQHMSIRDADGKIDSRILTRKWYVRN